MTRSVWAIADLHLAISTPEKTMEVFGPSWKDYHARLEKNWKEKISDEDLVLLPGDITWAMSLEKALIDLEWIDRLPGTKVMIKGNHDYWWSSQAKMEKVRPKTIHFLYQDAFLWHDIAIGGTRLWDTSEYSFASEIEYRENPFEKKYKEPPSKEEEEKIFNRELERLKHSLQKLDPKASLRIAMTHYPPIGPELLPSQTSQILETFHIDICVFGHLHNMKKKPHLLGEARGVRYLFCAADYCEFVPLKIV